MDSELLDILHEKVFNGSMRKILKRSPTSSSSESAGSTWTRAALKKDFMKSFGHIRLASLRIMVDLGKIGKLLILGKL